MIKAWEMQDKNYTPRKLVAELAYLIKVTVDSVVKREWENVLSSRLARVWERTCLPLSGILQGPPGYVNHKTACSSSLIWRHVSQPSKLSRLTHMTSTNHIFLYVTETPLLSHSYVSHEMAPPSDQQYSLTKEMFPSPDVPWKHLGVQNSSLLVSCPS